MKKTPTTTKKPDPGLIIIRIVKLAAFAALASFMPAHAQETGSSIRAETAWFLAAGDRTANEAPESFAIPVSGAARIAEIRQFLAERAAGTETRRLIPTLIVALSQPTGLHVSVSNENRNHSAPGAPLWGWHVQEYVSVRRSQIEVELYPAIPSITGKPSEIETLLRNNGLPENRISLIHYPIVMELKSEFPRSSLANVSNRSFVGTGDQVAITGFIVEGGSPRNVVVRALGPSLENYGVTGVLANPRLQVFRGSEKIAENDNWADGNLGRPYIAIVPPPSPFHLVPGDSREAALELTLVPGAYTIIVSSADGGTGIALTEAYTL